MSRIVLTGLPEPPELQSWCAICVGAYKQQLNDHKPVMDKIQAALKDGKADEIVQISKPLGVHFGPLQVAVTWAPATQIPGMPVVGLCWTHAPAIPAGPADNGKRVAPSGAIPGLTRGHG
jgi:hypothetical protein